LRNISDTIARLAALKSRQGMSSPHDGNDLPSLAGFGSNPGALEARLFVADDLPVEAPLVVVLHGCTQTAAGYDRGSGWSRLASEHGFAVLFAEQRRANNPNLCFNWFVPEDVTRDRGEALSIRQMIEAAIVQHGLDRKRIYITGLSAGGAMAAAMLATYPEVFAGGAIIAGLAYGSASTIPEAFDRMRGHGGPTKAELQQRLRKASAHRGGWPKISVWQGSADNTVAPVNADLLLAQWQAVHGVGASPTRQETVDGQKRRVWCDAEGNELIENYTIAGMGHGTPLQTKGEDGLGVAAPFMLDVGISSTRHIAAFWGLTQPNKAQKVAARRRPANGTGVQAYVPVDKPRPVGADQAGADAARRSRSGRAAEPGAGISKVIEDALRKAGLMN
jgi:poly(hydroxyalkanoate) depolymerase family esterase